MDGKILVTYATAAGSTGEIAEAIGGVLRETGISVDVVRAKQASTVSGFTAVVLGSGVRMGKPYGEAVSFLRRHQTALREMPVAYFVVCGALQENTEKSRTEAASYVDALIASAPEVIPVDTASFGGAINFEEVSFLMRLILKNVQAEEGDYRDWDAIRQWATDLKPALIGR
jgi:menaquinone-dependent protoporphyrinogen oxidase